MLPPNELAKGDTAAKNDIVNVTQNDLQTQSESSGVRKYLY